MQRTRINDLLDWLATKYRKPMVIRGARQVGKTWLVRELAKISQRRLIELNLEKQPELAELFASNDPERIMLNISSMINQTFTTENCLLFLDEIQAAPELLSKLRWFAEEMPELPVIAAGSLLEFILADHQFSMPVGRINYLYLEPLSFEEFLLANNKEQLHNYLLNYELNIEIPNVLHQQLNECFKEYTLIGGMPAAVNDWLTKQSLQSVNRIHHDLLSTYRDDFAKYAGKIDINRLNEVLTTIPRHLGEKFIYNKVNKDVPTASIKAALELLTKAKIIHKITACYGNGIPIAAETNEKYFKMIYLDVGLSCAAVGINYSMLNAVHDISQVNQGGISEQVVGQMLRTSQPSYIDPQLYYWTREQKGSAAEIDYLIQHNGRIIPIEVKSGSTGSLKSLHLFMGQKQQKLAVRINADIPSMTDINIKLHNGEPVIYQLLSLPFYLTGQLERLLEEIMTDSH